MDVPALILAIVLASLHKTKNANGGAASVSVRSIIADLLHSTDLSALLLGLAIGFLVQVQELYEGFYYLLFRGFLSILMLIMGMEAWSKLSELRLLDETGATGYTVVEGSGKPPPDPHT